MSKLSADELANAESWLRNRVPAINDEQLAKLFAHIAALEREMDAACGILLEDIRRENRCDRTICTDTQGPNCVCNSDLSARLSPAASEPAGDETGEKTD